MNSSRCGALRHETILKTFQRLISKLTEIANEANRFTRVLFSVVRASWTPERPKQSKSVGNRSKMKMISNIRLHHRLTTRPFAHSSVWWIDEISVNGMAFEWRRCVAANMDVSSWGKITEYDDCRVFLRRGVHHTSDGWLVFGKFDLPVLPGTNRYARGLCDHSQDAFQCDDMLCNVSENFVNSDALNSDNLKLILCMQMLALRLVAVFNEGMPRCASLLSKVQGLYWNSLTVDFTIVFHIRL